MKSEKVAILDCGGQYTKVIDRKVRELSVKSDIFPIGVDVDKLKDYDALILSGGPESVWSDTRLNYNPAIFDLNLPVLGICYGLHLLNSHFGGKVKPGIKNEYGETTIEIESDCPLFYDLEEKSQSVLMSHGDSIEELAPGFKTAALSGNVIAAFFHQEKKLYGVQFHPEVDLTVNGKKMLDNFLKKVCELEGTYRLEDRIQVSIDMIQKRVGDNKVMCLVSGGVDSAVTAALLIKALKKEQIYAIHVDHGFMRKDESDIICRNLKEQGLDVIRLDEEQVFLNSELTIDGKLYPPLARVCDPETKRNIIGHGFIEVVRRAMEKLNLSFDDTFLAQGTLRPDLIESGNPDVSDHAHKIKTHHNDVSIIRKAREKGMVIETNWDWHKDEVRKVARTLEIDERIASRQPFPGPGLAIRTICSEGEKKISGEQTGEFTGLLKSLTSEYYGEVVPVTTVGVQGDCRSYRNLAVLSGKGLEFDWKKLYSLGTNIPNSLNFVNRAAYVLNKKEVRGIKNFSLGLNHKDLELLREVDYYVRAHLEKIPVISQVFAVLLPIGLTKERSVAIRSFVTNDFMTGRPGAIPGDISLEILTALTRDIDEKFTEVDLVLYDVTSKPPATVEWE